GRRSTARRSRRRSGRSRCTSSTSTRTGPYSSARSSRTGSSRSSRARRATWSQSRGASTRARTRAATGSNTRGHTRRRPDEGALRDGNVYARGQGKAAEVVIGGAKSTKGDQDVIDIVTAYSRRPLGTVPVSGLTEIAADRRLRIAIKPFLDADETRTQLASPDPETRRGAAMKLGHQAEASAAPVVEAAIAKETVPHVLHALEEALALIRLAQSD